MRTASKLAEISDAPPENQLKVHYLLGAEVRLLGAVIRHAIFDWVEYRNSTIATHRRLAEKARRWIFCAQEEMGSFDTYCRLTGVDPSLVRQHITRKARRLDRGIVGLEE